MIDLTIIHLTGKPPTPRVLREKANVLTELLDRFFEEAFPSPEDPVDWPLIRVVPVTSADALSDAMFLEGDSADGELTDTGMNCILFLLDGACPQSPGSEPLPLSKLTVEGIPLPKWLNVYFPVQPKVVLTSPETAHFALPSKRWVFKPLEMFTKISAHEPRLEHLFRSFWEPRFWHKLYHYVTCEAGISWHTPGHNSGHAFSRSPFLRGFYNAFGPMSFRCDLSVSVDALGDLSEPDPHTPLADAQRLTAEIFGAAQSCYITNGSSTANKAMLMTLLRPGEYVLVDRNCHKSVHHAIVMAGAVPIYLPSHFNSRLGIWAPVALADLKASINAKYPENRKPRIVILTTCTYEGMLYPVWEIARLCEHNGMLFYADEAWAPYLSFHPYYTWVTASGRRVRYNAIHESSSAHFAVQSTHKTLAAYSQASMIHVSYRFKQLFETEGADFEWLRQRFSVGGEGSYAKFSHDFHEVLRYWHSTSPHYPMMATLDCAGVEMRLEGMRLIEERLRWIKRFKERVARDCGLPQSDCFVATREIVGEEYADVYERDGYLHDPLKMLLSFKTRAGCLAFQKLLHKMKIQWEKSTPVTLLFLVTMGTQETHFEGLYRAILQMKEVIGKPEENAVESDVADAVKGQAVVLPRAAALCDGELVPLAESKGCVSSQFLVPYPPGIPVFLPGLRITASMVDLIQEAVRSDGPDAVHGLFTRNGQNYVEVLSEKELARLERLPPVRIPGTTGR
jgi:arginine decarboxylase